MQELWEAGTSEITEGGSVEDGNIVEALTQASKEPRHVDLEEGANTEHTSTPVNCERSGDACRRPLLLGRSRSQPDTFTKFREKTTVLELTTGFKVDCGVFQEQARCKFGTMTSDIQSLKTELRDLRHEFLFFISLLRQKSQDEVYESESECQVEKMGLWNRLTRVGGPGLGSHSTAEAESPSRRIAEAAIGSQRCVLSLPTSNIAEDGDSEKANRHSPRASAPVRHGSIDAGKDPGVDAQGASMTDDVEIWRQRLKQDNVRSPVNLVHRNDSSDSGSNPEEVIGFGQDVPVIESVARKYQEVLKRKCKNVLDELLRSPASVCDHSVEEVVGLSSPCEGLKRTAQRGNPSDPCGSTGTCREVVGAPLEEIPGNRALQDDEASDQPEASPCTAGQRSIRVPTQSRRKDPGLSRVEDHLSDPSSPRTSGADTTAIAGEPGKHMTFMSTFSGRALRGSHAPGWNEAERNSNVGRALVIEQ